MSKIAQSQIIIIRNTGLQSYLDKIMFKIVKNIKEKLN